MIATTLLLTLVTALPAEDPPEKAPTPRAKPLTVHRWKSKNELRFTWATPKGYDGKLVRAVLKTLPKVFLYEGLPPQLGKRMRELEKAPKQLKLSKKERAAFKTFENWDKAWRDGLKAYAKIWKKWK